MKRILTLVLMVSLVALAGCKKPQDVSVQNYPGTEMYYSYPMNGQQDVSPSTPVVLGYMSPVTATAADFTLTGVTQDNTPLLAVPAFTVATINDGKSLVLTFASPLPTGATYTLTSSNSGLALPVGGLQFTVRPAFLGAIDDTQTNANLNVASIIPGAALVPGGPVLPFLDFSTIDLTFTQPLDPQSVSYGTSVTLMQSGALVPATVLVSGRKMTIDPTNAAGDDSTNHDLLPGVPVTLTFTNLKSTSGNTLASYTQTFTPQDTTPRATMAQMAPSAATSGDCNDPAAILSPLTGMPINCVPVIAKLLGNTTNSSQQGNVFAQLAFGPHFPDVTPLRIKKGALLKGGALSVNIGGYVPAGFNSGAVTVTFLSDADGYLLPNPFTSDPNAPKRLVMISDMGFDTADPRANGAFTQNLLHVTLVGAAIADPKTGVLKADAVGIVEPSVLGLEHAYGILSFHMESYPDQTQAPAQQQDTRTLELSSWVPGTQSRKDAATNATTVPATLPPVGYGDANNIADMLRPGDPILLNFTKPLDVNSVHGGSTTNVTGDTVTLLHNGVRQGFTWRLNGTSLAIYPDPDLQYTTQTVSGGSVTATAPSTYQVIYTDGLQDLQGNAIVGQTLTFTMPLYADVDSSNNSAATGGVIAGHSPVITAIYPGFPCYTDPATLDLAKGEAGTCYMNPADGTGAGMAGGNSMPIMQMPANRSIHVSFSQVMKADTIRLGSTFKVEQCESTTSCSSPVAVPGQLNVKTRALSFVPQADWKAGTLYRYTLMSDNLDTNASACDATGTAICSVDGRGGVNTGHPLKTSMLDSSWGYNMGGPDMQIYFTGAPASDDVLQLLQQYPVADTDASFVLDPGEPVPYTGTTLTNPRAALNAAMVTVGSPSGGGLVTSANVGCGWVTNGIGVPQANQPLDCPNAKYTFLTGALMADIEGYHTATEIQGLVNDGTLLLSSIPPALCGGASPCPAVGNINQGAILTWIYPTQLVASGLTTYSIVLGVAAQATPTGTQVMRIRYTCDANLVAPTAGNCDNAAHGRVPGWIIQNSTAGAPPQFVITLNVYMDAPNLAKAINLLANNMHNYPLTLNLVGPLTFLPDGRLQISQANTNAIPININLGSGAAYVNLVMPVGGNQLNYVGAPIEN